LTSQICSYAAWAKSDEIRNSSSSGGIFAVLAEYVIENKGVVFGAFQESNNDLHHIGIAKKSEIRKLQKSKYYQSRTDTCYSQVRHELENGTLVLFSGTACQVAGLQAFLQNKEYKGNLITVEILCHGVSNADVYRRYLLSQEKKYKKRIITSEFRTKDVPWRGGGGTSMTLIFEDGTKKLIRSNDDDYFIGFNGNLILRPSCYQCPFTGVDRKSDFMLADYWGLDESIVSVKDQEKGISLVVLSTERAKEYWKTLSGMVNCVETDIDKAIPFNLALSQPVKMHRNRDAFFKNYYKTDFHKLIFKCCFKERLYHFVWKRIGDKGISRIKRILGK